VKQRVQSILQQKFDRDVVLEKPKDRSFGHFATPLAFSLAKELRKSPMLIAEELASSFGDDDVFRSVESLKGYINFRLSEKFLNEYATWALENEFEYAMSNKSEKILLEFVSANPTGPLHIGHARGAVYGDTLLRLGRHLGYDITAEYYVNDAGNQIDLLGLSIQLEAKSSIFHQDVEYPEKYYRGEYLNTIALKAQNEFSDDILLNESRQKELALWAKDEVLEEIKSTLKDTNIEFDTFVYESTLYDEWDRVLSKIDSKGIYEEGSKIWLKSTELGDEKDRVVVREDGRATYLAGDIIYHNQKFEREYDHYINIWGADHHGYITRVNAAIDFLGYDHKKLEVILSQMVSLLKDGEPYKMSKRSGTVILMSDILEEIGSDALRFIFASKKCDTSLEFDVEELKKSDSSNPIFYIQYAHARIQTIISKSSLNIAEIESTPLYDLSDDADSLLFEALLLPEIIDDAFHSRSVQKLTDYLKSLASSLHKYYYDHKILDEDDEAKNLKLFMMVALSIRKGLSLLGIDAKNSM
jgi:arginyl-tRNA synthetase